MKNFARQLSILTLAASAACAVSAKSSDNVVLIDESGSMSGEQSWIATAIGTLDVGLNAAGVTNNQFGLIGFGASAAPAPSDVRAFSVGSGQFGTSAQFQTAAGGLVASGGTEDGWAAITQANTYGFRGGDTVRNYILITDEDRDNTYATTYATVLGSMTSSQTLLNAVVNASFRCGDGSAAIGVIGTTGYKADGAGGFTKCTGGAFGASRDGTTFADYVQLAWATGGGAWDLQLLRSGGLAAQSFTSAFIDGKVAEIVAQPVPGIPEPSTYALMIAGLAGVGFVARRRSKQA